MIQRWRPANREDVADVCSRLRSADREEIEAMWGVPPELMFEYTSIDRVKVFESARTGCRLGLAGVDSLGDPTTGLIWMIATDDLIGHQMEFLKYSKPFIEEHEEPYDLIFNWVDARNEVHLKWLRWCGFTFVQRYERFGSLGIPFYQFCKIVRK